MSAPTTTPLAATVAGTIEPKCRALRRRPDGQIKPCGRHLGTYSVLYPGDVVVVLQCPRCAVHNRLAFHGFILRHTLDGRPGKGIEPIEVELPRVAVDCQPAPPR